MSGPVQTFRHWSRRVTIVPLGTTSRGTMPSGAMRPDMVSLVHPLRMSCCVHVLSWSPFRDPSEARNAFQKPCLRAHGSLHILNGKVKTCFLSKNNCAAFKRENTNRRFTTLKFPNSRSPATPSKCPLKIVFILPPLAP